MVIELLSLVGMQWRTVYYTISSLSALVCLCVPACLVTFGILFPTLYYPWPRTPPSLPLYKDRRTYTLMRIYPTNPFERGRERGEEDFGFWIFWLLEFFVLGFQDCCIYVLSMMWSIGDMHAKNRLPSSGHSSPSTPSSPRSRSPRVRRGGKPGGRFTPGQPAPRTLAQRLAWILLSVLLRRQGIFLFAPLLYISGMLFYMGTVSFDAVPIIKHRATPGSIYRSPQLYLKLQPEMDSDNSSADAVSFSPNSISASPDFRFFILFFFRSNFNWGVESDLDDNACIDLTLSGTVLLIIVMPFEFQS